MYDSDESGIYQVYVRAFPDKGGKWQISSSGGQYPKWARNGHELFFANLERQVLVSSYSVKGNSFLADKPRIWLEKTLAAAGGPPNFDVSPDGKRIAGLMPAEAPEAPASQSRVVFLMNFFDELRRRVQVGK